MLVRTSARRRVTPRSLLVGVFVVVAACSLSSEAAAQVVGYGPPPAASGVGSMPPGQFDPAMATSPYAAGPYCPNPVYERLPSSSDRFPRPKLRLRPKVSGLYGRLEYLSVRLEDSDVTIGEFVPNFDIRRNRGTIFSEQPARPLLTFTSAEIDLLGNPQFREGEPFLIDNPFRGPRFDATGTELTPIDLSEPSIGIVRQAAAQFSSDQTNGIRGIVGRPWEYGLIEANVFGVENQMSQDSFAFAVNPRRGTGINPQFDDDLTNNQLADGTSVVQTDFELREFIAVPVIFTDGIPAATGIDLTLFPDNDEVLAPRQGLLLFDEAFSAEQSTELGGAGFEFLWHLVPDEHVRLLASTGFQYTRLDEDFAASATASGTLNALLGGSGVSRTATITADTVNHLAMATFGLRGEIDFGPLSLGAQPRVGLGGSNREVNTFSNGLAPGSVATRDSIDEAEFSATFDISTYARLNVRDWLSINVGYEFSYLSDVYRPHTVLDYTTVSTAPAVSAQDETTDFTYDRVFVGVEVILP